MRVFNNNNNDNNNNNNNNNNNINNNKVQLSITLLSYYWELGVFLDAKASKALRLANDTETFRDVRLTNNLILK